MATGVVIRLRNLPLVAGTIDIRHYFSGLRIPDGGVHIIGGDDGTAFILFATDEDARQAMVRESQPLCGAPIKLMLSSHSEMKNVIEDSQRVCEELRGLRPPEPPITNLTGRSSAAGYPAQAKQYHVKPQSPERMVDNDIYLEVKGLPFDVSENHLAYFFAPIPVVGARFLLDETGCRSGTILVKFKSPVDKMEGLKKDGKYTGNRFIKVNSVSERRWAMYGPPSNQLYPIDRKRPSSGISPNGGTPKRSRDFSPLRSDNCVEVRGLPSNTTYKSVNEFFGPLRVVGDGLFVELDNKVCKGRAFVEFSAYADYKEALLKDGDMMNGKQVRVIGLSKPNMVDQIRIHKKYIKAKREEERSREKEKKQIEKKLKEERKREHQLKKQKEMDDWLRRQHQKEEDERKRLNLEKKLLARNSENQIKVEQQRKINEQLRFNEQRKLEERRQLEEQQELEERRKFLKQQLQEVTEKSLKEEHTSSEENRKLTEEAVLGAGEMEIEDDSQNNIETASNLTSLPPPVLNSSAPHGFGFPSAFGTSGGIVGARPGPFVPRPMVSPGFPVPGLPRNFAPTVPGLPRGSLGNGPNPRAPPPLPSVIPPPPTPPMLVDPVFSLPRAHMNPVPIVKQKQSIGQYSSGHSATEFVRVANAPFSATENDVKNFFAELNIKVIQFVYKEKHPTGQIFIQFFSKEEAARAVQKNDKYMMGRQVLVENSSLSRFAERYKYITGGDTFVSKFDDEQSTRDFKLQAPPNPVDEGDKAIVERIFREKLSCVCIRNAAHHTSVKDVLSALSGINVMQGGVHVLEDIKGKCIGRIYVELQNPEECTKAAILHEKLTISGSVVRVFPLSFANMKAELEVHKNQLAADLAIPNSQSRGPSSASLRAAPGGSHRPASPHYAPLPPGRPEDLMFPPNEGRRPFDPMLPPRDSHYVFDPMLRPRDNGRPFDPFLPPREGPPADEARKAFGPGPYPPPLPREFHPPNMSGRRPVFIPGDPVRPPRSPISEEIMRMRGFDNKPPPFHPLPPNLGPPPRIPMNRHPFSVNPPSVVTVEMGNLNYKVTQEDILEFFWGFDPIPDSVRLMYDKHGKPTGGGVVSFPNRDAAHASVAKLSGKHLLQRPIKLFLQ